MDNFFKSYNLDIKLDELDNFLLKLGANLASLSPQELGSMLEKFKQIEMTQQGRF